MSNSTETSGEGPVAGSPPLVHRVRASSRPIPAGRGARHGRPPMGSGRNSVTLAATCSSSARRSASSTRRDCTCSRRIQRTCEDRGGGLVLVNPSPCVVRVLALSGLDAVLPTRVDGSWVVAMTDVDGESGAPSDLLDRGGGRHARRGERRRCGRGRSVTGVVVPTRSGGRSTHLLAR